MRLPDRTSRGPNNTYRIALLILSLSLFAAACAATSTSESAGGYIDDATITAKVKAAIVAAPGLSSLETKVETYKGVVQLSGFVNSQQDATQAAEVARAVAGVKSVQNNLIVRTKVGN
jgi:hyperosmotically inducible periplasmic protein